MPRKLSEAAEQVIDLAQASRDYWDVELPKRHPDYPLIHLGEDSGPPPPQEVELRRLLADLPADMIYQLLLIMYLGRGDFSTRNLSSSLKDLKETFGKPEWAASQMMDKAPLADYLMDGLAKLRQHRIDVDRLPLSKPVRPRK